MPQFAANISFLFTEIPFMDRFSAAKQAGFDAVEFISPNDYNMNDIKTQLKALGLTPVLCNLPAGHWAAGDRGTAANPARKEEFRAGVAKGIAEAQRLGFERMNCLAGFKKEGISDQETREVLMENIRHAAGALGKVGVRLMVEPINHLDVPGFALNRCSDVLRLLEEIGHPNAYLQLDVYHARRENEDVAAILENHFDRIGHVQIADCPGRHQPGTGETDFKSLFAQLDRMGYPGFVSLEYVPSPDTLGSLQWLPAHGYHLTQRSNEK